MRGGSAARGTAIAAALAGVLWAAAPALSQPRAMPAPASAAPDTVLLSLGANAGTPRPALSLVGRDTLRFGESFAVKCEFPAGAPVLPDSITARADWVEV